MTEVAEKLKQELSLLDEHDRAELARFLIDSLDEHVEEEDHDSTWEAELLRRGAEIEAGLKGIPASTVFAELDEKYS
jgi:putative addiction module component (TIGR02574 family)